MNHFGADFFDGRSARGHAVQLSIADDHLHWASPTATGAMPLAQLRWDPAVGQTHAFIHMADGGMFRVHDRALAKHWPQAHGVRLERWARVLEGRMRYALGALLITAGLVFAGLRWGVPAAASVLVKVIPAPVEQTIGAQTLQVLDSTWLSASDLSATRQQALVQQLHALCQRTPCPPHQILFRKGGRIGANAMALPSGVVLVTDELVALAKHDEEIMAVLAHELGHVQAQHGLRMALQSLGSSVILVAITGDLGNVSDMVAGLPALLLNNGYSRQMEREADDFAHLWLQSTCISPQRLADLLARLDQHPSETGLLDSHPGTAERIRQFSHALACT